MKTRIAIVGDFNAGNSSHAATNEAVRHCSDGLGIAVDYCWIGTEQLARLGSAKQLHSYAGLWIAPASPYKSMEGALAAIRWAREGGIPLLGTCGGFQHLILEYARNVLGITDADHEESNAGAAHLVITRLACSLAGRTLTITLQPTSLLAQFYGRTVVQEQYYCSFGVNPEYVERLRSSGGLRIVASDHEGLVRAVELTGHPFFVGTLFLPQHTSTPTAPHPLISGFLKACSMATAT